MIPPSRPKISREELAKLLPEIDRKKWPLLFVGIRGYYRDTMGAAGKNDRCIYDDAIILDSPSAFVSFNGNTDPNGYGFHEGKYLANLAPGFYPAYKFDAHRGKYLALCQRAAEVTVLRDDGETESGWFGINIHKGGTTGTSSLGCQTIPPVQWDSFIALAESEARRIHGAVWKRQIYPYCLIEA